SLAGSADGLLSGEEMVEVSVQAKPRSRRKVRTKAPSVSVVIPVYNEQDSLRSLKDALRKVSRDAAQVGPLHIIFVDDGSSDGSWPLIVDMAKEDPDITSMRLRRNFGKAAALEIGVHEAKSDIII